MVGSTAAYSRRWWKKGAWDDPRWCGSGPMMYGVISNVAICGFPHNAANHSLGLLLVLKEKVSLWEPCLLLHVIGISFGFSDVLSESGKVES